MGEDIKYVFKKPYVTDHGVLHENSEIRVLRGSVYFDGGMVYAPIMPANFYVGFDVNF